METLAFIYSAAIYEDTTPHQLRSLDELGINLSSSTWLGLAGAAVLSILITAPDAQAIVQRGDTCPAVRDVQTALQRRGYEVGEVDGVFGAQTEYAVLRFQQRNGLNGDRKVDAATAQVLGLRGAVYNPEVRCSSAAVSNTTARPSSTANPSNSQTTSNGSTPATVTVATNGRALNVRSEPSTTASVITSVPNGTAMRTNGRRSGRWIGLERGGWVAAEWVRGGGTGSGGGTPSASNNASSNPASAGQVRVATNGSALNVRSGPGTNYAVTGVIANGAVASTSGRTSDGWIQLASGGWVSSSWVGSSRQVGTSMGGGGGTNSVTVTTNGNPLNARSGPGTNFNVSTIYSNGSSLRTTGRIQGGWVELENGLWVSSEWID